MAIAMKKKKNQADRNYNRSYLNFEIDIDF